MLSEYITSLANVSFYIVVYMYAGFSIWEKIRCGLRFFGVFLCGFAVFGPPYAPLSEDSYGTGKNCVCCNRGKVLANLF